MRPRSGGCGRDDDQQGRALADVLVEPEEQDQGRHDQDARTDPEQSRQEPGAEPDRDECPDGQRIGHQRISIVTATTIRNAANTRARTTSLIRCMRSAPARTPTRLPAASTTAAGTSTFAAR